MKRCLSTLALAASCAVQLLLLLPSPARASGGNPNGALVYSAGSMATSGTTYVPVGGGATGSSTESTVQTMIPGVTQISEFTAVVGTAPGSGNSWAFTWRDNATSETLTCTISGTATSCSDTTDSFTTAANDLVDIQVTPSGTPASTTVQLYAQLAGGTPWSSLTNPTAALSLSQGYTSTFTCTLTSADCFKFQDTGVGTNSNFLVNIDTSSSPLSVVNPLRVGIEGVDQMKVMEFTGNNGGIYFGTTLTGGPFGAPDPVSGAPNSTDISKYVMTAGTGSFGVLRLYQGNASPANQGILQIRQYGTTPGAFITTATGCLSTDASDSCTAGPFSVSGNGAVTAASYTAGGNPVPTYTGTITAGDCAKWSAWRAGR